MVGFSPGPLRFSFPGRCSGKVMVRAICSIPKFRQQQARDWTEPRFLDLTRWMWPGMKVLGHVGILGYKNVVVTGILRILAKVFD